VRFWDAQQEQGPLVHKAKESLYQAQFSGDGQRIIDAEGTVLDASTGNVIRTISAPKEMTIRRAVFLADNKRVILACSKSDPPPVKFTTADLILWDVDAGREISHLPGVAFPSWLHVSPNGRWLVTLNAIDDKYVQQELVVRDAATWEPVFRRKDPPVYGRCALFSNDSSSIVLGEKDGLSVVEIPSGQVRNTYGSLPGHPLAVAVSPDGRWVAAALSRNQSGSSTILIWDAVSGVKVHNIPQTADEDVVTLAFSPDGRRLASAGFAANIKLWDTESGLELLTLTGHKSWIWIVSFSPDGQRILSCGRDRTVRIWIAGPLPAEVESRR
jgi:WD40 repeat protein